MTDKGDRYGLKRDDGTRETRIPEPRLRDHVLPQPRWKVGDRVEVNLGGEWWPGTVTRVNADGTYEITLDDGSRERDVPEPRVRARGLTEARRTLSNLCGTHHFSYILDAHCRSVALAITA